MRKLLFCILCLMLLFMASALAETYRFNDVYFSIDIPKDYEVVLTPYNLSAHSEWMQLHNMDYDATLNEFEAEGVYIKAYDAENNRTFVLTALKDLDGQTYFDLNNQDDSMRKEYRTNHTNGIGYSTLGYVYSSAKWVTYKKPKLRFLQTKYSLRQEGQQVCTGYQRRTIRNGMTYTLDMQVRNRDAGRADDTALESLMKAFQFTEILAMPEVPVKLTFTSQPPSETNTESFTIKGKTAKGGKVSVMVASLGNGGSQTYNPTVNKSGSFSLKVKLPTTGQFLVSVTAEAENAKPTKRDYTVVYQKNILPVNITTAPVSPLTDTTTIAGTTIRGAKTQLSVSGPITYNKTSTSQSFKFKVDTSAPGTYHFVLYITKSGVSRTFTYAVERVYTEAETAAKIRSSAKKVTYTQLTKNIAVGKGVTFDGYIASINPSINEKVQEWVITIGTTRKSDGSYKNFVYLISTTDPQVAENAKVKIYGTYSGSYSVLDADGNLKNYPRVDATFIEPTK